MARPAWPGYARMLADGYSDQPDFGALRSDIPGLATQRARWEHPIVTRSVTILVQSKADRVRFDDFMRVDLTGGSGWFSFIDPVDHASKLGRFVDGSVSWSTPGVVWQGKCKIESIG